MRVVTFFLMHMKTKLRILVTFDISHFALRCSTSPPRNFKLLESRRIKPCCTFKLPFRQTLEPGGVDKL